MIKTEKKLSNEILRIDFFALRSQSNAFAIFYNDFFGYARIALNLFHTVFLFETKISNNVSRSRGLTFIRKYVEYVLLFQCVFAVFMGAFNSAAKSMRNFAHKSWKFFQLT